MENNKLNYIEIVPKIVNNIFILLHGYGSNNNDLLGLGMNFRQLLPNTAFIYVNGPWQADIGSGYQWFSLKSMNLFTMLREIKISHNLLNKLIDEQLQRFSLNNKNLLIGGFSQGAMMSLYNGIRRDSEILGILSFSGLMADTIETLKKELKNKSDTLLIHGTADRTVPYSSLEKSENLLREFDIPYESHSIQDMGHTINDEAIYYAQEFIKKICNKIN